VLLTEQRLEMDRMLGPLWQWARISFSIPGFSMRPPKFRRSANIPSIVVLHFDDLPANEVEEREGCRLTRPIRTIVDVSNQREVSGEILSKAFTEARIRGLVTGQDIELYRDRLPAFLLTSKRLVKAA
jgi:hypothetical protein